MGADSDDNDDNDDDDDDELPRLDLQTTAREDNAQAYFRPSPLSTLHDDVPDDDDNDDDADACLQPPSRVQVQRREQGKPQSRRHPLGVDLVLIFRSSPGKVLSRPQARENARQAERQYSKLLGALSKGGLRAVGKSGENDGQLLVLVSCPQSTLSRLAQRERHSDFVSGLPTADPTASLDLDATPLSPADHLRLVHTYVTSTVSDGGLGIAPGSTDWDRVESIMMLHDHAFNDEWIRSWTQRELGFVKFDKIRYQFGEAIALYFAFLSYYTKYLIAISAVGVYFFFFHEPYSSIYSSVLLLWSIAFVESWRIRQRILSVRWGTRGSFRVEKRRAQYVPIAWWQKDLRMITGLPVILLFATVLAALLTSMFLFEAFVTELYTGPGHRFLSFAPTIIVSVVVPRFLKIYHSYAVAFTDWEDHAHQSTHDGSLTLKTFSLSAIVEYLGLALSAFVYVPFGEEVMTFVQTFIERDHTAAGVALTSSICSALPAGATARAKAAIASASASASGARRVFGKGLWEMDVTSARTKLSPTRLQDQMFASTVTNQVVNAFIEIGLPYVLRAVSSIRRGKGLGLSHSSAPAGGKEKKRVMFEDEAGEADAPKKADGKDKAFMEDVWQQVALPDYELFEDYSEMVTQFGHVALWSTIWPLAPLMALTNNWFELRSDAFKIARHVRRPIPARTDTIGPWLDSLSFLSWLAALTNSALVYLFRPSDHCKAVGTSLERKHVALRGGEASTRQLLLTALLVAFAASHGYIVARVLVRHVLERLLWRGTVEEQEAEHVETVVKVQYLKSLGVADVASTEADEGDGTTAADEQGDAELFWADDEGLAELGRETKEA
ncbi:uncharacterized protein FIBRA_03900 [Fibroporia radiculosa]|uniref:DUF590-domain-containing protein n=1 Tax=Fibroporia radiculosa TaxID=599839 RepID=J4HW87_9APHY|nr:uncharacterized protein FIBRA_03900 [Fibroporia radiculosa]CCM01832.1 predicted protein [Fibroporia radiculosa]